ncbi:Thaumatin-like protein 1 [Orobanche gracilis]
MAPEGGFGTTFTLMNRCGYTVWPGILSNTGSPSLGSTGFQLQTGATQSLQVQPGWSGRLWGRTGCSFDPTTGQGSCTTGDCGSNQIECNGGGAAPPATLVEFTIASTIGALDFYDVSLVDGYNLPMMVEAVGGSGVCGSTGCVECARLSCGPRTGRLVGARAERSGPRSTAAAAHTERRRRVGRRFTRRFSRVLADIV